MRSSLFLLMSLVSIASQAIETPFDVFNVGFETGHAQFSPDSDPDGFETGNTMYQRYTHPNVPLAFAIPKTWVRVEGPTFAFFGEITSNLSIPERGRLETITYPGIRTLSELAESHASKAEQLSWAQTDQVDALCVESPGEISLWIENQQSGFWKISFFKSEYSQAERNFSQMLLSLQVDSVQH